MTLESWSQRSGGSHVAALLLLRPRLTSRAPRNIVYSRNTAVARRRIPMRPSRKHPTPSCSEETVAHETEINLYFNLGPSKKCWIATFPPALSKTRNPIQAVSFRGDLFCFLFTFPQSSRIGFSPLVKPLESEDHGRVDSTEACVIQPILLEPECRQSKHAKLPLVRPGLHFSFVVAL